MTDLARVKVSVCRMWTDWMTDLANNIPTDSNPDFAIQDGTLHVLVGV